MIESIVRAITLHKLGGLARP